MDKIKFDRRLRYPKTIYSKAYAQMVQYFAARYSWGQPCDPRRAEDWATLCAYIAQCNYQGTDPRWYRDFLFPSGNVGCPSKLVGTYHDGWELLQDLGLVDCDDRNPYAA